MKNYSGVVRLFHASPDASFVASQASLDVSFVASQASLDTSFVVSHASCASSSGVLWHPVNAANVIKIGKKIKRF